MRPIAKAASVLLVRGSDTPEFYVVKRAEKLRFFGGFHAFPGGKVAPEDRIETPDISPPDEAVMAAARELFEETGILVARDAGGLHSCSGSVLQYVRRKLMASELTFAQVLERLELKIVAEDYQPAGNAVTPAFAPIRFDTDFFVVRCPAKQTADVWPGELDEGTWITAELAVDRWLKGEWLLTPPSSGILNRLCGLSIENLAAAVELALAASASEPIPPIFFAPEVQMIPLRTIALPPSTHTNAFLVGREKMYLLDPGSGIAEEQQRLFHVIDQQVSQGRQLAGIVLTHQHPDHVDGAAACVERYKVAVFGHPLAAQKLKEKVRVDRELNDGDRLDLGRAPDGQGTWHLEAVHTPGHASGHLAFYEPHYRLLFAADMVSTLSSVVIAPPDGDLAVYMQSLRRLQSLDMRMLLPAHGNPSACPQQVLAETIAHREQREEQLVAALGMEPRSIHHLAQDLYKGLLPQMMRFAELQVKAGLLKLETEKRVRNESQGDDDLWALVETR